MPWLSVAWLVLTPLGAAARGDEVETPPAAGPRPIAASVDPVVKRMEEERLEVCRRSKEQGVPCFPVSVEAAGPEYSVAESLKHLRFDGSPAPSRPPTHRELLASQPWPILPTAGGFDPVCAAKALVKSLKGKNAVYYLYRVRDRTGERPILTERPLDPKSFEGIAGFEYELVRKIEGECEAIAAYRRAERESLGKKTPPPVTDGKPEEAPRPKSP